MNDFHRTKCRLLSVEAAGAYSVYRIYILHVHHYLIYTIIHRMPRVLVAFECWGSVHRRLGGIPSAQYEHNRFVRIVQFLDQMVKIKSNPITYSD